ncbi:MAG TPA: DUF4287 domain-containing protein [Planctomycetota bacterium]
MTNVDKALQTQLANIETRTGKKLAELFARLTASGLQKHGEMVTLLKTELGMGHGDANTVVHKWRESVTAAAAGPAAPATDVLDAIYSGSKAALRPLHEAVMAQIGKLGEFEIAPKKAYVSLRRKKQFAMVGPASRGRIEVGLNMRGVEATERLVAMPEGGMCQYKVFLANASEVDKQLLAWVRTAFDSAG